MHGAQQKDHKINDLWSFDWEWIPFCRGGQTRTDDLLVPNQAYYQTVLHPEKYHLNKEHQLNLISFLTSVPPNCAERGGFEPPVQSPVRQFSKLLVSATHPSLLFFGWCKCRNHFQLGKTIRIKNKIIDDLNDYSIYISLYIWKLLSAIL